MLHSAMESCRLFVVMIYEHFPRYRNILPYVKKYGTHPVTGEPLHAKSLIKLNYFKNSEGTAETKHRCDTVEDRSEVRESLLFLQGNTTVLLSTSLSPNIPT